MDMTQVFLLMRTFPTSCCDLDHAVAGVFTSAEAACRQISALLPVGATLECEEPELGQEFCTFKVFQMEEDIWGRGMLKTWKENYTIERHQIHENWIKDSRESLSDIMREFAAKHGMEIKNIVPKISDEDIVKFTFDVSDLGPTPAQMRRRMKEIDREDQRDLEGR